MNDLDHQVRLATFEWLRQLVERTGEIVDFKTLQRGFEFQGQQLPLVGGQGIFKSRFTDYPLTILTTADSPYDDGIDEDGLIRYSYRGSDPYHPDNVGLRTAMTRGIPLAYFRGIVKARYLVTWPVYIIGDDPRALTFRVAADDRSVALNPTSIAAEDPIGRRSYVTRLVNQRVHQAGFRERVLQAYRKACTVCNLRHPELLDAAHIIPDGLPSGEPIVRNGLSLCKIHHAAYDARVLGISPDYQIFIREDVLDEIDGPMLKHGLVEMHNQLINPPRDRSLHPDRDRLAWRFEQFRMTA